MSSVKIKLRLSKKDNNIGTIYFQVIIRRRIKIIGTSLKIYPHEWDSQKEKVEARFSDISRTEELLDIQQKIQFEYGLIKNILYSNSVKDIELFNKEIERYKNNEDIFSFFSFVCKKVHELRMENRHKTAAAYLCAQRIFANFLNGRDINIDDINEQLIISFEKHLICRGVSSNSTSFYMRTLRAIYNCAVKEKLSSQVYPFKGVYTGIGKTVKRAVNQSVIEKLEAMQLDSKLSLARDLFLFSFYTRGMAFIDMANLKKTDIKNGIIIYKRNKTKQKLSIKVESCMDRIIKKYNINHCENIFPIINSENNSFKKYLSSLGKYNRHLREISKILKLSVPLTSYVSRHTWASIAKKKGIPIHLISEGMGHYNESTTRIYLASIDQKTLDKANLIVIGKKSPCKSPKEVEFQYFNSI